MPMNAHCAVGLAGTTVVAAAASTGITATTHGPAIPASNVIPDEVALETLSDVVQMPVPSQHTTDRTLQVASFVGADSKKAFRNRIFLSCSCFVLVFAQHISTV